MIVQHSVRGRVLGVLVVLALVGVARGQATKITSSGGVDPLYNSNTPLDTPVLKVGITADGVVSVVNGGQITAGSVFIAGVPPALGGPAETAGQGPDGFVSVAGSGSSLTTITEDNSGDLFVGYTGQGTLSVESDAQVSTGGLTIGAAPYATGNVLVGGENPADTASLTAQFKVLVGVWANVANLTVRNGGSVTAGELQIGGMDTDQADSLSQAVRDQLDPIRSNGTVTVESGSTLDVAGPAYIGYSDTGTVNVTGGTATAYQTAVGLGPISTGTLTVDGAAGVAQYNVTENAGYEEDTHQKTGALIVGAYGNGTATVKNGGQITADRAVYVGGFMQGELPFTDQIDGQDLVESPNGTGTLTIQDHDSSLTTDVLAVGATGHGILNLHGDAQGQAFLTTTSAGIGVADDSHGEATVGNKGSWANSGSMFVGGSGTGTLAVQSGGHVDAGNILYIGGYDTEDITSAELYSVDHPTGTGTVTVQGNGTLLDRDHSQLEAGGIGVGIGGTGTLSIQNGGRVDSRVGVVGTDSGTGTVLVNGTNSLWRLSGTGELPAEFGAAGHGTVTVSNGGKIQVDGAQALMYVTDSITVGSTGPESTMSLANGAYVKTGSAVIGGTNPQYDTLQEYMDHQAALGTGTGTVTITGASSKLETVSDTFVGFSGTGTLNVEDGQVLSRSGWLGMMPDATGTALFTGTTAAWTNSGPVTVGGWGHGGLNIEAGAHVSASEVSIGGMPFAWLEQPFDADLLGHGTGTVTVTGEGSTLDVANPTTLYVGYSGTGTLNVLNQGQVNTESAVIGAGPDAVGTVIVDGDGSKLSVGNDAIVGAWGEGHLTVSNQGQMEVQGLYIGGMTASQAENIDQEIRDAFHTPAGTGFVTVTGTDSSLTVTGEEAIVVGAGGTGTLTIANHGQVTSPDSFIGGYMVVNHEGETETPQLFGGTGTAHVTGGGSWTTDSLVVGVDGSGTLDIASAGQVNSYLGGVGLGPNSHGTASVTGPDSAWVMAPHGDAQDPGTRGELLVGGWGTGAITVASGGHVDARTVYLGGFDLDAVSPDIAWGLGTPTGTGTITVTGADAESETASQLNVTGDGSLYVGYTGTGTLNVAAGGQATSNNSSVGYSAGSTGTVNVTGAGSQWQTGDLVVGSGGTGTMNVNQGGQVTSSDGGFLGYSEGSTGTVNVAGTDSQWNVGGNLFVGGTAAEAGGTGTLTVTNGGLVDVSGEMTVWETGTLRGDGTVTVQAADTLHNYGTIAPGTPTSIGTLTVNGDVVFEPGSTYDVKLGPGGTSDKLEVTGNAAIQGGTLHVAALGTVIGEHDYQIVHANTVTLGQDDEGFDDLSTALLGITGPFYGPDEVTLHIVAANFDDPSIVQTPNQREIGGALQEIAGAGGNAVTAALQDVDTPESLRHDYDQLSGQSRPPLAPLAATGTSRFLGTVSGRVQSLQSGLASDMSDTSLFAMSGPDSRTGDGRMSESAAGGQAAAVGNGSNILADSKWGLWGRGYGLFGDRETERDAPGYTYHMYGGSLGLDYQFTEQFLGGVVFGVTNGDVDFAGVRDTADLEVYHVGLYGNLTSGKWYLNSMATYGHVQYDTERFVDLTSERLSGDLNGNDWSAYVEAGQNLPLGPQTVLQPLASLQYSYLGLDSYTETGGVSALSYDDQSYQSVKGSLGARLTRQLFESVSGCRGDGQLRARWVHEFGDSQSSVDTSFASNPTAVFTIRDAKIARDSAVVGAGLGVNLTKQLRASADYDALLNTDETVQMVSAALQYRW